jgi:hypothetical protein
MKTVRAGAVVAALTPPHHLNSVQRPEPDITPLRPEWSHATRLHPMKFIGSATVALIILLIVDEALNDERFTRSTIAAIRQALASTGIHFWVLRPVPRWRTSITVAFSGGF